MDQEKYSQIGENEISILEKNGCWAENWSDILVAPGFDPTRVRDVIFEGKVSIGALDGEVETFDGTRKKASIFKAKLRNVHIGDNCLISNVHGELSNLKLESGVIIENVGQIGCTGETSFGNGHEISVLNEAGGRELKITRKTSAQVAYLTVLYRDNKALIEKLNGIADQYEEEIKQSQATIHRNAEIRNCTKIINVLIGESAIIDGVLSLEEGTVDSSSDAPTVVRNGVIADNFIFQKGSKITDGAVISSTLVGEGCQVGKQFTAENSALFANSEGFQSEVCSIFAGPYSVTHHKSTLLIAGMVSFFNAGSGTNQSNHMYKLGPVHQGLLERGCKTGSSSYLLWPARVGAFTAILGKHYANFDSSDLPFSYINESDGKSVIIPGMNFFTSGTFRDGEKWPARDRRKSGKKLDFIHFDVLSPYTVQKVIRGNQILTEIYKNADTRREYVSYNNIHIKRLLLKTCKRYYQLIIDKYFGDVLIQRLEKESFRNFMDVIKYTSEAEFADAEWVDINGLICSKKRIDVLIKSVVDGNIKSFDDLHQEFEQVYQTYEEDAWNWMLFNYKRLHNCELFEESGDNIVNFLTRWKESSLKLLNMVLQDSQKEFDGNVKLSFGIDGNADADFENVRGSYDENLFVKSIKERIDLLKAKYEELIKLI